MFLSLKTGRWKHTEGATKEDTTTDMLLSKCRTKLWWNIPVCRPLRLASFLKLTLAREWTTAGFLIIKPSRCKRLILRRELARAISLISLGSNQILRFPHFNTEEARRFWSLRETVMVQTRKRETGNKLVWLPFELISLQQLSPIGTSQHNVGTAQRGNIIWGRDMNTPRHRYSINSTSH